MKRIALLAVIWGWSFLFIKVAVEGMTPTAVAGARITLGALVMTAVLRARGTVIPRDRALLGHFAIQGVVASAIPFTLLAWGEQYVSSALTAVLNASTPLFAAGFAAGVLGERLRRPQLAGLVLGFVGVGIAAGVGGGDLASSSVGGSLAAVGAAACYGLSFAYARRFLAGIPPLVAATGQLIGATVFIAPVGIATTLSDGIELTPTRIASILILGVIGTGFAYLLNYQSIAAVGPTRASIVTQLVPVVAVAVGVAFLDEHFHLRLIAGGALTLFGIALLNERVRRFRPVPVAV
ncbi:MAG TPA: DMT family transporter [Acidimicrobiales bacterium]|jgi:drug/metabolite transporter (DMT)-like permease|nr:DMT family transporter [Acidimicrobiales bacterium]